MINIDVSKIFPPKALDVLAAFIPGLFFEISILLANPALVRGLWAQAKVAYQFGYYLPLVMAAVLAFVIGVASTVFVGVIQRVFIRAQGLKVRLCAPSYLLPKLNRLSQKPRFSRNRLLLSFRGYLIRKDLSSVSPALADGLYRVTSALLRRRYGVEPPQLDKFDLDLWGPALAPLRYRDVWGNLFFQAIHATGWCGIVAMRFAPVLRNTYFLLFSLLLIVQGIGQSWATARSLRDPKLYSFMILRAMLAQLGRTPAAKEQRPGAAEHLNRVENDAPGSN